MILDAVTFIIPLVLVIILLVSMLKILREYERGVVYARTLLVCERSRTDHYYSDFAGNDAG